jgi:hypothetical protein
VVLREAATLEELACGFVERSDGYPEPLWGSTPIKTFMSARTSVSVEPSPSTRAKDIPTLGPAPIPLLSHSALGTGGTQA